VTASRPPSTPSLVPAYLARREDMRRFFAVRAGRNGEVEDLMQDLYLKVQRVDGKTIENASAYLYRLASNLLVDRARSQRRAAARDAAWRRDSHVSLHGSDIADMPDAEAAVGARLRLERLIQIISDLPDRTQRVFWLHKFDGLTHAETAQKLGISRSAVEKHMSQALRRLATEFAR
jgi:RNA polymerase sigma-70 factor (ECF subfamily)